MTSLVQQAIFIIEVVLNTSSASGRTAFVISITYINDTIATRLSFINYDIFICCGNRNN